MDYQSNTWSEKNKLNSVRFMYFVSLNGLPMFILPKTAFMSTGKHNDCNTFDWIICHNYNKINKNLPPS